MPVQNGMTSLLLNIGVALIAASGSAQTESAAEPQAPKPAADCAKSSPRCLKLFELEVQHAKRSQLRQAILRAKGVPLTAKNPNIDEYDVSAIELPGVKTLEVLFDQDSFVFATYHANDVRSSIGADEKLRKMLVTKYGVPRRLPEKGDVDMKLSLPLRGDEFTTPFGGSGRFIWTFANDMHLIYKKGFFGDLDLSYVDSSKLKAIHAAAEKQDAEETNSQATEKANAF